MRRINCPWMESKGVGELGYMFIYEVPTWQCEGMLRLNDQGVL